MEALQYYDLSKIIHIRGIDHPDKLSVGPDGVIYTTGTGGQVYKIDLEKNTAEHFASTTPRRILGQAVDANDNLYCSDIFTGIVIRITPNGQESTYATGPGGQGFLCPNYPAFDRHGFMYLSDSGDWSGQDTGHLYKIPPGGGEAQLWFPIPIGEPIKIALDAEEKFLYFVEHITNSICRIAIKPDGSAGAFERIVNFPRHVPDGITFDEIGRLWIAMHRPDSIYVFDLQTRLLKLFAEDWKGEQLRGPTDIAFAGSDGSILLA